MRILGLLAVLFVITTTVLVFNPLILRCSDCLSNVEFYEIGETTCPYCNALKDFFQAEFCNNYYFCPIDTNADCYRVALDFFRNELIGKAGLSVNDIGVPTTLVIKRNMSGNYLLAVVIGAIKERSFWTTLACSEPSSSIPIYFGDVKKYDLPLSPTEHSAFINKYIIYPVPRPTSSNKGSQDTLIIGIASILMIVAGLSAYTILSRRFTHAKSRRNLKRRKIEKK